MLGVLLGLSAAAGCVLVVLSPSNRAVLVTAIALLLWTPIALRIARGTLDGFEPLLWINIAFTMMFVVRPIALAIANQYDFHDRFHVDATLDRALLAAFVGIAGLYIGYFSGLGGRLAARVKPLPDRVDNATAIVFAWGMVAAGLAAYSLAAYAAGTTPLNILTGTVSIEGSSAYLYGAPFLAVPAALLLFSVGIARRQIVLIVLALIFCVGLVLSLAPGGQRFWIFTTLASLGIYPLLKYHRRVSLKLALVIALPAFFTLSALGDLRPGDGFGGLSAAVVDAWEAPERSLNHLVVGPDTEMVDGLAVEMQYVPDALGYHPGHTITSALAHPIPRNVWPDKPYVSDGLINAYFYGDRGITPGDASVAYSVLGSFYYDSGFIGVVLGMMLLGVGTRLFYEYWRQNHDNNSVMLVYAASLPLIVILMRGNIPDTLGRALFLVGPLLLVCLVGGRRTRPPAST